MKGRLFATCLWLSAVLPCVCMAETGDARDVRVIRTAEQEPRAALLGQPSLALWKEKHLVAAYQLGIAGKTDMGSIDAVVSTDDGQSWSIPSTIFDSTERHGAMQFGYCNAVLYKPPGQEVLWCFAMRCPLNYADSEDSHLAAAYSGDGGRSWNPVELAMHYTGPLVILGEIQRIEEDGHPVYAMPAHRNTKRADPHGTREHFVLRSTSLMDWHLGGYVPLPKGREMFLHEGQIAVMDAKKGQLKMVMRTSTGVPEGKLMDGGALNPPRAWSSNSEDGGRSWSVAKEEPELWNTVSEAWYGRSGDGRLLYVYNDGPTFSRMALRYKVSNAYGVWGPERTFFDESIHNSYPTLIEVAPGEFRAVWDSGDAKRHRRAIRFGKLSLPDLKPAAP
ncbi:sialidase family protein [Prosthecobacter vanneervenii]|uniref:Sialidase domain-containing protein n=1 Tax=Prosthecobacter vanneervenii TaxID=48466 RepID=A0A7W7YFU6_9BACT|nr:sialidase family protein [Prosthecobacter vanneervenii]MBB5035334.1 hypothetical protein [Prosthecobacter vanneervenii]